MKLSNWRGEIHREVTGLLRELLAEGLASGYTPEDAKACGAAVEGYVTALEKGADPDSAGRETAAALGELHGRTGILNTPVREAIVSILEAATLEAGLEPPDFRGTLEP